jgi:hypothetical protein
MLTVAYNIIDSFTISLLERAMPIADDEGKPSPDKAHDLASLGAELLRRAQESQPALEAAWDALMSSWGVHGQPVGAQRLSAMIAKELGTRPEDNTFSRELIALREESRP